MTRPVSEDKLLKVLRMTDGSRTKAAEILGLTPQAVYKRIKENENLRVEVGKISTELVEDVVTGLKKLAREGYWPAMKYVLDHKGAEYGFGPKSEPLVQNNLYLNGDNGIKVNRLPVFPSQGPLIYDDNPGEVNVIIPVALAGIWQPKRFFIASSGRGAGKSWTFARELIARALEKEIRVGCFREVQRSMKESVHHLLADQIKNMGVDELFKVQENKILCKPTGSEFIFQGLFNMRSSESVKSLEGLNIAWVEEAQTISEESWQMLSPTIREEDSEIWCSLNPRFPDDVIYSRFLHEDAEVPERTVVAKISWRDNPWFPDVLKEDMEVERRLSEAHYQHIWEGELRTKIGEMIPRDLWQRWLPGEAVKYKFRFISADTAFSKNVTADYSVLQLWGFSTDHIDLLDSRRGRWSYPELIDRAKQFYETHMEGGNKKIPFLIEKKASGQSMIQSLAKEGFRVKAYDPKSKDKVERVHIALKYIANGNVRIPPDDYAPWVKEFLNEASMFSDELLTHDDQVDAMTQAVIAWATG